MKVTDGKKQNAGTKRAALTVYPRRRADWEYALEESEVTIEETDGPIIKAGPPPHVPVQGNKPSKRPATNL